MSLEKQNTTELSSDVDRSYLAYYLPIARPFQRLTSGHFPTGTSTREHCHSEIAMHGCLRGPLVLKTLGTEKKLDAGDFCLLPPNVEHCWINPSDQTAATIAFLIDVKRPGRWPASSGVAEACQQLDSGITRLHRLKSVGDNELQNAFWGVADLLTSEEPQLKLTCTGRIMTFISVVLDRLSDSESVLPSNDLAKQIRRHLLNRVNERLTISDVARSLDISSTQAKNAFRSTFGCGIITYFNELKIWQAKRLLSDPNLTIEEIAYRLGFSSPAYFSQIFRKLTGGTPSAFRSRNDNE